MMKGLNSSRRNNACEPAGASLTPEAKLFVIALRCGRLANRLVLSANFIALAEEQGHRLVNFAFHSYSHLFEGTRNDIYCQYPPPARQGFLEAVPGAAWLLRKSRILYHATRGASRLNELCPVFGKRVLTLREPGGGKITLLEGPEFQAQIVPARLIFAYGWRFRAPGWVRKHAGKIRACFQPVPDIEQGCRRIADDLRRRAEVVVGVHIRQGDYRAWKQGRYFFPASRYAGWMREMSDRVSPRRVAFYVCSDEARTSAEFEGLDVGLGGDSPAQDLYTLARCDYVIGPPSTFSQWASFYGDKPLFHLRDTNAPLDLGQFRVSDLGDIPGDAFPPDYI